MLKGRDIIVYLAIKYNGDWNTIYEAIRNKELVNEQEVHEAIASIPKDLKVLTIIDQEYPDKLKQMYKPPFVLFYKGALRQLDGQLVGVAGSNKHKNEIQNNFFDKFNYRFASTTFDEIGQEIVPTVAVYDRSIKNVQPGKRDLIITEYFNDDNAQINQTWAARLLVGISKVMLFTDILKKTTSPLMIAFALYLNKDVFLIDNGNNYIKGIDGFEKIKTPEELRTNLFEDEDLSQRDPNKLPTELH